MQFIDLKRQYERIKQDVDARIHKVLDSGLYIMGPEIIELENRLAEYVGVNYCVACSSGTDALIIPLMALGISKGDAVFTTPFTFIATAEVISLLGATPVFVDIDEDTFNISPSLLEKEIIKINNEGKLKPKVIIPVDLFGLPANYNEINDIALKYNILVLEDAAQGFGGKIDDMKACSFGDISATSFFPAKPLGCYGDGGAIFTNDKNMLEILKSIRVHGQGTDRYENIRIGLNGRLDSIQAAVLLAKLNIFDDELKKRNNIANLYSQKLNSKLKTPTIPDGFYSSWAQYSVLANDSEHRTNIQNKLKENNIPTAVYYPIPLHLQKAFAYLEYKLGDFPVSEYISQRIFSLPMHPYLSDDEIDFICNLID